MAMALAPGRRRKPYNNNHLAAGHRAGAAVRSRRHRRALVATHNEMSLVFGAISSTKAAISVHGDGLT